MENTCGCGCSDNLPGRPKVGDHDVQFTFGHRPTSDRPYPFTTRQYGRLLVVRGRVQDSKELVVTS